MIEILIVLAALVLAVLFAGVIRSIYQERFPMIHYSVAVVAVLYLVLSFSHMDAWIASYNIAHDQTSYLYELSTAQRNAKVQRVGISVRAAM